MRAALAALLLAACGGARAAPSRHPAVDNEPFEVAPIVACAGGSQPSCASDCRAGDAASCEALGTLQLSVSWDPEGTAESSAAISYGRACQLRRASGCRLLAEIYWDNREVPGYEERAHAMWEKGCQLGDPASCDPEDLRPVVVGTPLVVPPPPTVKTAREAFALGTTAYNVGDFATAVAAFRRALELMPGEPAFLYNTAQAYRLGGDILAARDFYAQFLARAPAAPNHIEVAERIRQLDQQIDNWPPRPRLRRRIPRERPAG